MKRSLISFVINSCKLKLQCDTILTSENMGHRWKSDIMSGDTGGAPFDKLLVGGVHVGMAPFWFASFLRLFI